LDYLEQVKTRRNDLEFLNHFQTFLKLIESAYTLSPAHLHSLAEGEEDESANAPRGYTRGMQDPKHRGQMLCSPIKNAWITTEKFEMEGPTRRKCWVRVHRSTLTAQDKVFSTRFHYKVKRKHGKFEKCKVRLVVQGQHMHRKDEQGVCFITAGPITKLCALGEEESGGHVL
jgi:hypothetical protein